MADGPTFGLPRTKSVAIQIDRGLMPGDVFYKYMRHATGPAPAGEVVNLQSIASEFDSIPGPAIYTVELGTEWMLNRMNIGIFDNMPTSAKFGGLAELANGCLIQVVDANDNVLVDFTDGEPIKKNADFNYITGIDTVLDVAPGVDFVRVRFTIAAAGNDMIIGATQKVRFVIQDDLSGLVDMRCMCQGIRLR